jgi:hypothetical protein
MEKRKKTATTRQQREKGEMELRNEIYLEIKRE